MTIISELIKKFIKFIFIFVLFSNSNCFGTIRILTFHYNQPDFIEIQYKTLKKFLKDDFELIVFNDAKSQENTIAIQNICNEYGITCVRFKPEWHLTDPLNIYLKTCLEDPSTIGIWGWDKASTIEEIANNPSVRHSHVIQYALDHYGYDHDDIVVIMDGDNFLIKPLSLRLLLGSQDIISFNQRPDFLGKGRKQLQITVPEKTEMPWVVFVAFNPSKLPNPHELQFHVDVLRSDRADLPKNTIGDTGAAIYKYLEKFPELKILAYHWQDSGIFRSYFTTQELQKIGFSDCLIRFIHNITPGNVQFFVFEHFMHFSAVSAETTYHDQKVYYIHKFIDEILNE